MSDASETLADGALDLVAALNQAKLAERRWVHRARELERALAEAEKMLGYARELLHEAKERES